MLLQTELVVTADDLIDEIPNGEISEYSYEKINKFEFKCRVPHLIDDG